MNSGDDSALSMSVTPVVARCQNCGTKVPVEDVETHAMACEPRQPRPILVADPATHDSTATAATSERLGVLKQQIKTMIGMELPESERLYEILLFQINRLNEMIALNQEPSDEFLESVMAFEEVINQMTVKAATLTSEERETASANSSFSMTYQVVVLVPIGADVFEVAFSSIPASLDIGEIRENVAEHLSLDPSSLIIRYRGQTCFPFDDSTTMGELIGNTSDNVVQLTIFTRTEADKFGISKDYEEERRKREPTYPFGAQPTFMTRLKSPTKPVPTHRKCISEFMTEESRAEIQEFITTAQRSPSETSRRGSGDSSAEDVSKQDRKEAIPVSISDQETVAVTPSPADEVDTISPTPPAPPPPPPPPSSVPAPPPPPVPPPVGGVLSVGPMLPPGAVACRPFYWNKLPVTDTPSSNVIWNRLSSVSIARKTIEANFSKKPKLKASVRQRPSIVSPSASQPAKAELPDTQFSQRLDIVLHKLPPVDDVIRALRDLDETVLDLTTLRLLLQTVPRPSDIEFVSSLECEITTATATAPVVFIKGLISVPFWETRLRSLKALREYEEESSSLYEEIALLSNAMKFLVQSTSLRSIFGSILFIGNQMNLGSARGSAKGFRLDAIAKLRSMKCNNNPHTSLLDFLVKQLSRNAAQALEFPQQIGPHLVNVKRAELAAIHQKIADLTSALERQSGASLAIAAKLPQGDSIHALSDSFKSALEDAESLRSIFSSLEDEAMRLLAYFGLTLDSAVSMFAELSPASQAAQSNKKQQEDNARRMWDTRKVDEVFAALSAAAMARRTHEDDPTSSDARYKREEGIKVARRLLCEWVTVLEWDEQSLRSPAVVSSAASEKVSQLSDVISKLFKLFKDFSEEFAGSVSMLVRMEQARRGRPRDEVRVQTSACVPSLDEPSLEQVIGAAMQSRRRISESPSGRSDAASSAWSAD